MPILAGTLTTSCVAASGSLEMMANKVTKKWSIGSKTKERNMQTRVRPSFADSLKVLGRLYTASEHDSCAWAFGKV
jgi:hypothetical protein